MYVFTNLDQDNEMTVELYTNGAMALAGSTLISAALALFLF